VLASGAAALVLYPDDGTPLAAPQANDYWVFVTLGPLRFLARINATLLRSLPAQWLEFVRDESTAKLLARCGSNPRSRARGFIQNSLVDGYVTHPVFGSAMAHAVAWLLSTIEGQQMDLSQYRLFGYDISCIAGPPGKPTMFNFRAVFNAAPEQTEGMLDLMRALPLPAWRPPPH